MKRIVLLLTAMTLFFVGCSKKEVGSDSEPNTPPNPTPTESKIEISEADKTINFTSDAGERSISFSTSGNWTAAMINNRADEWCSISPTAGNAGFSSIKIAVANNDTTDERSASVQIKSGTAIVTIVVTQKQQDALTVTQSRFDVGSAGGDITIVVASNVSVEYSVASGASSWIHPSQGANTRAVTTSQFKFSIDPNTTSEKREGAITIYGEGLSESVMVYQDGEAPSIVVSTNNVMLTSSAQSFAVEVSHNVDVTYELSDSWLSHADTRAMSTNTYVFNAAENDDVTERTATIKFINSASGLSETVQITQQGAEPQANDEIPTNMTIAFPDPIFREYVLSSFDSDKDGKISKEEALKVKSLYAGSKNIASLEGVQYFTNLTFLSCYSNRLTSLDVSKNTALTYLSCDFNQLTSLDVSKNTALTTLRCYSNQLTSLDVSKNTALTDLDCDSNQLTSLDVSKNTALTSLSCSNNQLTSLDAHGCKALVSISAYGNKLTNVNVSGCTALEQLDCNRNQLQNLDISTNTALVGLGLEDNLLTALDASNNTQLFDIDCPRNKLTSLILPKSSAFKELTCSSNQLTNLDVSGCTELTMLRCYANQLTSLDVSKNTALTELSCGSNQLTSLDVSKNTALTTLSCYSNQLTSLDVSKTNIGNSSETHPLNCSFMSTLETLYLKKGWSIRGITEDNGRSTSYIPAQTKIVFVDEQGNVAGNPEMEAKFPDPKFRAFVLERFDYDKDGRISESEAAMVTEIELGDTAPASLKGIEYFTNLRILSCVTGQLTSLDVSKNTKLEYIECYGHPLTELNVSHNTALTHLACDSNKLTSLDVSKNTALTYLNCSSNQLTSLDVSNNTALTTLWCQSNPITTIYMKQGQSIYYLYKPDSAQIEYVD